jgi:diguanylate cyclase (GGDEF)-like protein
LDKEVIKVLLVEDDEDDYIITRDLLSEIAEKHYELEWVSSYDPALESMQENKCDVYLLDYRLGEHTGLDLLQEAIENGCTAPIILLTGQGDHQVDVEAMKAGASDYLIKGRINADSLERSIRYSIERKKSEKRILQLAFYDSLTGLPNQTSYRDRLQQVIAHARRYNRIAAVLFLDLDNFKRINDTLGHRAGDHLLKLVSERLNGTIRSSDSLSRNRSDKLQTTVARQGGDEFTLILTEIRNPEDAAKVAHRLVSKLSEPYKLEGYEVFITVSIGIAIFPVDGEDIDSILMNADAAMYHAKKQGKNNFQFYRLTMNERAMERLNLENDLRKALERDELLLHFQPKVGIESGKVVGMEALIRWQHPEIGMVSPAEFIPMAEETGLIVPIGEWVLQAACAQINAWQAQGLAPIPVSVNISSQQFQHQELLITIGRLLESSGIPPERLMLEITESVIMQNTDSTFDILNTLTAMGLRLLIDDFVTGYSSVSYLKRLPVFAIKIDRSFINDIATNPDDAAIIKAIIAMAQNLKLKVVAEGVETEEQLAFLRDEQCDVMQGYLFSRPLPAEEVSKLLAQAKEGQTCDYFSTNV